MCSIHYPRTTFRPAIRDCRCRLWPQGGACRHACVYAPMVGQEVLRAWRSGVAELAVGLWCKLHAYLPNCPDAPRSVMRPRVYQVCLLRTT
jgi:hypothetical protein